MLDLKTIETFVWVAELSSFRATAEKLNTTQPAVSQRIASLESNLGVRLLDRDARGVKLTAKGLELLSHAQRMLQMRQDMMVAAREARVMSGLLRIGVAETIVQTWLSKLIERIHASHPALAIEIEVDTSNVLRHQLMSRQIDLAFMMGPNDDPRLESLFLCEYPLAWVCSPRLGLGKPPISLDRIAEHPVITYASASQPYRYLRSMFQKNVSVPPRMYGSASLSIIAKMTRDAIGVAVIAPVILHKDLADGSLRLIKVRCDPLPALQFMACWAQGPDAEVASTVALMAQEVAKAHRQ